MFSALMPEIFRAASPYRLQQGFCICSHSPATAQRVKLRVCTSARGQSQRQYSWSNDISVWPREQRFAPPVVVAFLRFADRLVAPCGKAVVPQTFLSVVSPAYPIGPPLLSITSHSLPNPVHPSIMPIQLFMEPHGESAKGADPAKIK